MVVHNVFIKVFISISYIGVHSIRIFRSCVSFFILIGLMLFCTTVSVSISCSFVFPVHVLIFVLHVLRLLIFVLIFKSIIVLMLLILRIVFIVNSVLSWFVFVIFHDYND